VRKSDYARKNYYDVWLPNLAPGTETLKIGKSAIDEREWARFARRYRSEMRTSEKSATLNLLAALSHQTDFSVGCYCEDESHCHRSVLRALLVERGAKVM
jgi:uncharacterized protein YeaO (DUF488 family)